MIGPFISIASYYRSTNPSAAIVCLVFTVYFGCYRLYHNRTDSRPDNKIGRQASKKFYYDINDSIQNIPSIPSTRWPQMDLSIYSTELFVYLQRCAQCSSHENIA